MLTHLIIERGISIERLSNNPFGNIHSPQKNLLTVEIFFYEFEIIQPKKVAFLSMGQGRSIGNSKHHFESAKVCRKVGMSVIILGL